MSPATFISYDPEVMLGQVGWLWAQVDRKGPSWHLTKTYDDIDGRRVVGLLSSLDESFVDSERLAANLAGAPFVFCLPPVAAPESQQADESQLADE